MPSPNRPTSRPLSPQRDSFINSRLSSPAKSVPSSPVKAQAQAQYIRKLPKLGVNLSNTKRPAVPSFQIYEDKPEDYQKFHESDEPCLGEPVHDDKENILQPKVMDLKQSTHLNRKPLANLDISKFPGHLYSVGQISRSPIRLSRVYQPKNYNNESRTIHKFNGLPSFVTPPRNAMKQMLHRSGTVHDDVDDLELRLISKSHDVIRRKRAMSVGVNKGKAHLVSKNRFKILSS